MRDPTKRRLIPTSLAVLMLGFVLAASLAPDTGTVAADSSCPYGNCVSPSPPFWSSSAGYAAIGGIVAVGVVAALLALYFLRRGRGGAARAPRGASGGAGAEPPAEEAPPSAAEGPAWESPTEGEAPAPEEPAVPPSGGKEGDASIDDLLRDIDDLTKPR